MMLLYQLLCMNKIPECGNCVKDTNKLKELIK